MPEGPELYLSAQFVNRICNGRIFSGKVTKSAVSLRNPDLDWDVRAYTIRAQSHGKEMKIFLTEVLNTPAQLENGPLDKLQIGNSMNILFRFGMSGRFAFTAKDNMEKHAHLNFYVRDECKVLSFVDMRRFGRWEINADWGDGRGPCILQEGEAFRSNVLENLSDCAFNKAICETMLNQKYFNGIGNYLRAEILYRLGIPPFEQARRVLEKLVSTNRATVDLLDLCTSVANEVVQLGPNKYMHESTDVKTEGNNDDVITVNNEDVTTGKSRDDVTTGKSRDRFESWLQCYYVKGMKKLSDHNKRTIWFTGPAGPLTPSEQKNKKRSVKIPKNTNNDEEISPYFETDELKLKRFTEPKVESLTKLELKPSDPESEPLTPKSEHLEPELKRSMKPKVKPPKQKSKRMIKCEEKALKTELNFEYDASDIKTEAEESKKIKKELNNTELFAESVTRLKVRRIGEESSVQVTSRPPMARTKQRAKKITALTLVTTRLTRSSSRNLTDTK